MIGYDMPNGKVLVPERFMKNRIRILIELNVKLRKVFLIFRI